MLYLSRIISQKTCGIVDTDDGSETVVAIDDLFHLCGDLEMDIKGVTVIRQYNKRGGWHYEMTKFSVYQGEEYSTVEQAKLMTFKGVNVKVMGTRDGKEITSILVNPKVPGEKVIRLSDYGNSCSKYIFREMPWSYGGQSKYLTIILDDKIKLVGSSLSEAFHHGVILDIREVNFKSKTIQYVCSELSRHSWDSFIDKNFVIASQEVLDYFKVMSSLNKDWTNSDSDRGRMKSIFPCTPEISNLVARVYGKDFLSISKARLLLDEGLSPRSWYMSHNVKDLKTWLEEHEEDAIYEPSFEKYITQPYCDILRVLSHITGCNKPTLKRYYNFVRRCYPPKEIKDAYTDFVNRALRWLLYEVKV